MILSCVFEYILSANIATLLSYFSQYCLRNNPWKIWKFSVNCEILSSNPPKKTEGDLSPQDLRPWQVVWIVTLHGGPQLTLHRNFDAKTKIEHNCRSDWLGERAYHILTRLDKVYVSTSHNPIQLLKLLVSC